MAAGATSVRIDAHQHFWRYSAADYPWINAGMNALRRDWLPKDLKPCLEADNIDACIAVQARSCEQETDFLLDLADQHSFVAGVVGWIDLSTDDIERRLERWQHHHGLAGFRHPVQDEPDAAAWFANPRIQRAVRRLQSRQYVYELLVFAHQLDAAVEFAARVDGHWLVLDHLGKPAIRAADHAAWRQRVLPLRTQAHVLCKVSGLVTEAAGPDGHFDAAQIERYLDTALEVFGPGRLMYGSDWPVCLQVAPYPAVSALVRNWAGQLSPAERGALWGGTAARCYDLNAAHAGASNHRAAIWT